MAVLSLSTPVWNDTEFVSYLSTSGILDALTQVIVALHHAGRPVNPTNDLRAVLGKFLGVDLRCVIQENDELVEKLQQLRSQISGLKSS